MLHAAPTGRPEASAMTCAYSGFDERNTEMRRRSLLRLAMRARTRRPRRLNRSLALLVIALPLLLLAFLAADMLVAVLDALALIGLRLAEGADHCRGLPDPLPVG